MDVVHGGSGRRRVARRATMGLIDQSVSSLTNFGVGLVLARTVSARDFGVFSIVIATYTILVGLGRALNVEAFTARLSWSSQDSWAGGVRSATGATLVVGCVAGLGMILLGLRSSVVLSGPLVALGFTLPGLLLQDAWRHAFFAQGRGSKALINDLSWAGLLLAGFGLLLAAGKGGITWLVLAWGIAATGAAFIGIFQSSVVPHMGHSVSWWKEHQDLAGRYFAEFLAMTGALQLSYYVVAAFEGLHATGALRGAQLLLGPFNVLFMAAGLVAVPEAIKARKAGTSILRPCLFLSLALASSALMWGFLVRSFPDALGIALLGSSWAGAQAVVFPWATAMAGLGVWVGALTGLRAVAAAKASLRAQLLVSPMILIGAAMGVAVGGAVSAAWGLSAAFWIGGVIWWRTLLKAPWDAGTAAELAPPEMTTGALEHLDTL
ncbi:MAG TPA: hypothetical protein VNC78_06570 [Actinomycetota bacterium]|nr:hypothetical protein [Actinomycetota bacterium]